MRASSFKTELYLLIADTLRFIKERQPSQKKHIPKSTPRLEKTPPSPPPPSNLPKEGLPIKKVEALPKENPLLNMISKHLPHLALKKTSLSLELPIAILAFDPKELSFLKTLATTLKKEFGKVVLLDAEKCFQKYSQTEEPLPFCLFLSSKSPLPFPLGKLPLILLASSHEYEQNILYEKELILAICQRLSQNS